jgi:hypothetical protein
MKDKLFRLICDLMILNYNYLKLILKLDKIFL